MADPLLNTLCSICHISTPKYTCPGCNTHTCSLACNKKHKSWANCSGKRDPTAYMPPSKLKTAAGIDHDYNFLSAIERERERNQREIVDERRLFSQKELGQLDDPYSFRKQWFGENVHFHPVSGEPRQFGSDGEDDSDDDVEGEAKSNRRNIPAQASQLTRQVRQRLAVENVQVVHMPVGMTRQRENTTGWNRRARRINWCVEWILYDVDEERRGLLKKHTRIRHNALESLPLYKALGNSIAWYRKGQKAEDDEADDEDIEPAQAGRRKKVLIREVKEDEQRGGGLAMQDSDSTAWAHPRTQYPTQSPFTGAWSSDAGATATSWEADEEVEARRRHRFYLLRPLTVAGRPKELIPVAAAEDLSVALFGRTVLEYPTIYVLPPHPSADNSSSTVETASQPPLPQGHILGSTERRATTKRQPAAAKRKAGPKDDVARQPSQKRQAVSNAGIPIRPPERGRGGSQRGRGGAAAASARGRGRGRGGRLQATTWRRHGGDQEDAEEGEVNSDGDEMIAAGRADTSSSDPDSSSDEDDDGQDGGGFWGSSRPSYGGKIMDDDDDDDGPPEEERTLTSAPAPAPAAVQGGDGIKKPGGGMGLVDYGSDSEDGSDDDEDGDVDLAALKPENPELVAGAIQEIVGLLS